MRRSVAHTFSPDRLRGYRDRAALSREQLAYTVGTSSSVLRNYEIGITAPTPSAVYALARALSVRPGDLSVRHSDPVADYASAVIEDEEERDDITPKALHLVALALRRSNANAAPGHRRVRVGAIG